MTEKTPITSMLKPLIIQAMQSGNYISPEDFMSDLGHAMTDQHEREAIRVAWLRAAVRISDERGGEHSVDEVFDELDADLAAMEQA